MYVVDKPLKLREVMTKMSVSVPTVFQISYRSIKEHKIKSFGNIKQPVQKKKKCLDAIMHLHLLHRYCFHAFSLTYMCNDSP